MSVSAKLADYNQTKELLSRLKVSELRELALESGIALEIEDSGGKVRPARTKEEIIGVLVNSEFKEADLVRLLGLSRLRKEELLNQMSVRQLRRLANETGILLEKTSLFGTKRATKKEEIVSVLKVLSSSKIREYGERISLIKKPVEKEAVEAKGVSMTPEKPAEKRTKKEKGRKRVKPPPRVQARTVPTKEAPEAKVVEVPVNRRTGRKAELIEEAVREKITEREIIRRRITTGMDDRGLLRALRSAPFFGSKKEREYEAQLSNWLAEKGYPVRYEQPRRGSRFDLVLGENETAIDLKPIKDAKALKRLIGKIRRHKNQFGKVFIVLVDELQDPNVMRKEAEKIEEIDPERIKVIVKKPKKK